MRGSSYYFNSIKTIISGTVAGQQRRVAHLCRSGGGAVGRAPA